jgi:beta-1,4-N-acetylglucosaminyltransferase
VQEGKGSTSRAAPRKRVMLVCSAGGHLTEMAQLREAFSGHDLSLVTYHSPRGLEPLAGVRTHFLHNIGASPVRLARAMPGIILALALERPQVIVSTGSEIAIPFFFLAKALGIRTVFIESWCRVSTPSGTGRLVYRFADRFFVQWDSLLDHYGPKAEFRGRVA